MKYNDNITMSYSGILTKNNKPYISVRFERQNANAVDFIESGIPSCEIINSQGFSSDEIHQIQDYLKDNKFSIIEKARGVGNILSWF